MGAGAGMGVISGGDGSDAKSGATGAPHDGAPATGRRYTVGSGSSSPSARVVSTGPSSPIASVV